MNSLTERFFARQDRVYELRKEWESHGCEECGGDVECEVRAHRGESLLVVTCQAPDCGVVVEIELDPPNEAAVRC